MDYNLLNGGLILKAGEELIISDLNSYETIYKSDRYGMFWFMNLDDAYVYYSDQSRENALCRMNLISHAQELILDKPCYELVVHKDWIYYISESDYKLYRCLKNGKEEMTVADEQIVCFFIEEDRIFYGSAKGITVCDETGRNRENLSAAQISNMVLAGNKLVYIDKDKQHILSILDLETESAIEIKGIAAESLNTDGRYLYCSDRLNCRSIYRVDLEQCNSIRICGESAEYLHIVQNELYFYSREWRKMSLMGGQSEKVMR